jgi:toxin CcdB
MAQFTVHQNKNPHTRSSIPFLLDIQNDLLRDLETRVVVPLRPARPRGAGATRAMGAAGSDVCAWP